MAVAGVTTIDDKFAAVTFTVAVPLIEPEVAVIVVVPALTAVSTPELSTFATPVSELDQDTPLRLLVLPSSFTPVADNWSVPPCPTIGDDGFTVMLFKIGAVKKP